MSKAGIPFHVIDQGHEKAASRIAAGICNPVTGRFFVKSWMYETFWEEMVKVYREMEQNYGIDILDIKPLVRFILDEREANEWSARSATDLVRPFVNRDFDSRFLEPSFKPGVAMSVLQNTAQVHLPQLIRHYRHLLRQKNLITEITFDADQLEIEEDFIRYKAIQAERIVFCQGYQNLSNPWFKSYPMKVSKGDVLHLKIPELDPSVLVKHYLMAAPLGDDIYWFGAGYQKFPKTHLPESAEKDRLISQIEKMMAVPYEIVDHQAGIRPTTRDRRPFLGVHPFQPRLFIFNGLGAKGASLGPYWSAHMLNYLENGTPLHKEVDIHRFIRRRFIALEDI